jgi:hypothetical protein
MESGVLGRFSNAYSISLMDSEVWSAKNNRFLIEKSFPGEFFGNWFGKSRWNNLQLSDRLYIVTVAHTSISAALYFF